MPLPHPVPTARPLSEQARATGALNPLLPPSDGQPPAAPISFMAHMPVQAHGSEPLPIVSHVEMAEMVITVLGPLDEAGKPIRVHPHLLDIRLWTLVLHHFTTRGELFVAGGSPELGTILRQLGLLNGQQTTKVVAANLVDHAATSLRRPLHRRFYMAEGYSPGYLNAGGTRIYKVTADAITECAMGEDSVVLLTSDIAPWPPDEDIRREIARLRPILYRKGAGQVRPSECWLRGAGRAFARRVETEIDAQRVCSNCDHIVITSTPIATKEGTLRKRMSTALRPLLCANNLSA